MVEQYSESFEKENRILTYKREVSEQIRNLLKSGNALFEVANLLGAEEFITKEKVGQQEPVLHFDVQSFIEKQIESGEFMKLPDTYVKSSQIILPPDSHEPRFGSGSGSEKAEILPRTKNLIEILSELNLTYSIIQGSVRKDMMRKTGYNAIIIPQINKLVLINDEEWNATFIIHEVSNENKDWNAYLSMSKQQLKELPYTKVSTVRGSKNEDNWKERIKDGLMNIPQEKIEDEPTDDTIYEAAPDKWLTMGKLIDNIGRSKSIPKLIKAYKIDHPEWFKKYKSPKGQVNEYLHPDFIDLLREHFGPPAEYAPKGWMTMNMLKAKYDSHYKTLKLLVDSYRESKPEWFKDYKDAQHRKREHFHPELVAIIDSRFGKYSKVPEGWMNNRSLYEKLESASTVIDGIVSKYRADYPEWFAEYRGPSNKVSEHYHPDLIKIVESEVAKRQEAPEGWISLADLAKALRFKNGVILDTELLPKYREEHPEWFHMYLKQRKYLEHVSPILVKKLLDERNQQTK